MVSAAGFNTWYGCVEERYKVAFDERMLEWVQNGSRNVLAAFYDAAWVFNGGTVGDGDYQTGLDMLGSRKITVSDGSGGSITVINSPTSPLVAFAGVWDAADQINPPCELVRGR